MTRALLFVSILLSVAVQAQIPLIGEREVSPFELIPAEKEQHRPRFITGRNGALLTWWDRRRDYSSFATPVSTEGDVLDPIGQLITAGEPAPVCVDAAFSMLTGRTLLRFDAHARVVASIPFRSGGREYAPIALASDGIVTRVLTRFRRESFRIFDACGVPVSDDLADPSLLNHEEAIVTGTRGLEFLVLRRSSTRIEATRITTGGSVERSFLPYLTRFTSEYAALAGGPDGYLFVHHDWRRRAIDSFLLHADGGWMGRQTLIAAGNGEEEPGTPAVIATTLGYEVVWTVHARPSRLHYVLIAWNGEALHWRILQRSPDGFSTPALMTLDDTRRLIAFASGPHLFMMRFSLEETESEQARTALASAAEQALHDVAASPQGFAVAWTDGPGPRPFSRDRAYISLLTSNLDLRKILEVGHAVGPVAIAGNGDGFLAGWIKGHSLYVRRLSAEGEWLDPAPVKLATGAVIFPGGIASNGRDFMVTWTHHSERQPRNSVLVRAVSASGELGEPTTLSVAEHTYDVVASSDGSDYLVAWTEGGLWDCVVTCPLDPYSILAQRVSSEGQIAAPQQRLGESASHHQLTNLWTRSAYLVSWSSTVARLARNGVMYERLTEPGIVSLLPSLEGALLLKRHMRHWPGGAIWQARRYRNGQRLAEGSNGDELRLLEVSDSLSARWIRSAAQEGRVMLCYTREIPEEGYVQRVRCRLDSWATSPSPRRAVAH